jgi:hypothetical protein
VSVLREILLSIRRNVFVLGGSCFTAYGIALVLGVPPVPLFAVAMALGAVLCVLLAVPGAREAVLRKAARRPRRVMTPGDYERLRELEAELGWEPSEPLMPVKAPASPVMTAEHARRLALSGAGSVSFSSLSGSGFLSAHACDCGSTSRIAEVHVPESADPVASYCTCCGRRTDDDVAHVLNPDTTTAATAGQYVRWLQGYVKNGGKITHWYDYPFARAGFRYAASTVTVDSDYEYGARGRRIIVARNVRTERTRPTAAFGGWAHTRCYWMHGYRTSEPRIVAAYSDPEFDEFRHQGEDPGRLPAKAAWDDVAYASEASQHFAQLARVGREHCVSYCPICQDFDRNARAAEALPSQAMLSAKSRECPAGAYDFHLDSAGREWCRDADGLCWIKPVPDGPWYRQNKTGRE